ncbi:MAG TPA: hypothetical protein VKS78_16590 [Roseiarcus sp.]|nr:hypothetical protein [Roseiarcus sp.]
MRKRAFLLLAFAALGVSVPANLALSDGMAVAPLPDGRLELFVASKGKLLTAWKQTADPNSPWSPLGAFSPAPSGDIDDVAVGILPDKRLELFITSASGVSHCWKQSPGPSAPWSNWTPF